MGNPTKVSVIETLKSSGIEYDENATYNELRALLPAKLVNSPVEEGLERIQKVEAPEERLQAPTSPLAQTEEEDYLRQYQFKDQAIFGSKGTDPAVGSKAATMKKHLLSQPKVSVMIPLAQGESPVSRKTVCPNGYRLDLPKQTYIQVPQEIANAIMDSENQTNSAIMRGQINASKQAQL